MTKYDIVGIGNAIVDVLAYHDEAFLNANGMTKGAMTLVDENQSAEIYEKMGAATECSGGSAANTLAGFAMLGGKAAFIGKVKDDQLGSIFRHDIQRSGVAFDTPAASEGNPTAKCMIFVTEHEGQFGNKVVERTMATYLGIAAEITEKDIDEELIKSGKMIYFEGYLWDSPSAKAAIQKAITIAHKHDIKVAFTLSDALCVERHRDEFRDLINNHVDIFFANEHEIEALYGEPDMRKVLGRVTGKCEVAVITRSEKGSYILTNGEIHDVEAAKVDNVYDVTGAGDLYASGYLYGYSQGLSPDKCGKIASLCAAEVIKYIGARPVTKLSELMAKVA